MPVKKVFLDTLKFITDMELKNSLSTILMLRDFLYKVLWTYIFQIHDN